MMSLGKAIREVIDNRRHGIRSEHTEAWDVIEAEARRGNGAALHVLSKNSLDDYDDARAMKNAHEAARMGYTIACDHLVRAYWNGDGVPQNLAEAFFWCCVGEDDVSSNLVEEVRGAAMNQLDEDRHMSIQTAASDLRRSWRNL